MNKRLKLIVGLMILGIGLLSIATVVFNGFSATLGTVLFGLCGVSFISALYCMVNSND